jgi:hypothetical protein
MNNGSLTKTLFKGFAIFACSFLFAFYVGPLDSVWAQVGIPKSGGGGGGSSYTLSLAGIRTVSVCVDAGANDTYTCDLAPAIASYAEILYQPIGVFFNTANTTGATLNINGIGAQAIVKPVNLAANAALATGDISVTSAGVVIWDGTNFQLKSTPTSILVGNGANTLNSSASMNFQTGASLIFNNNTNGGIMRFNTVQTPDTPGIETGTLSNCYNMFEIGDTASDMGNGAAGTSASTDPCINIHSAVADQTQYNTLAVWGHAGGAIKTLTESAATSVIRIPVAAGVGTAGEFCYTVQAYDATDQQVRMSCIKITVSNKAGTETCTLTAQPTLTSDASIDQTEDGSGSGAISTGTLTYAITCDATPANAVDIQINAVSSLTQTTLQAVYNINLVGPGQPARQ